MSEPVLSNREVNVLQAVNLTLGTSAFFALADALPKLVAADRNVSFGLTLFVVLVVAWAIKLIVENHRSFRTDRIDQRPRYAVFQLMMAVLMFLALGVSAKNADNFPVSATWLSMSLVLGLAWLAGLAVSFGKKFDAAKFPWVWVASALVTAVGAGLLAKMPNAPHDYRAGFLLLVMLGILVWDIIKSNSFSVAN